MLQANGQDATLRLAEDLILLLEIHRMFLRQRNFCLKNLRNSANRYQSPKNMKRFIKNGICTFRLWRED